MDWYQVLTIVASTIGCCWFFRRETKEQIAEMRLDMREFHNEMKDFHNCMKDFHGRLCTLEERYIQLMTDEIERRKR